MENTLEPVPVCYPYLYPSQLHGCGKETLGSPMNTEGSLTMQLITDCMEHFKLAKHHISLLLFLSLCQLITTSLYSPAQGSEEYLTLQENTEMK